MATDYQVKMSLWLRPINQPRVLITVGSKTIDQTLTHTQEFKFDFVANDQVTVQVHHVDKLDSDPTTAVEIASVTTVCMGRCLYTCIPNTLVWT